MLRVARLLANSGSDNEADRVKIGLKVVQAIETVDLTILSKQGCVDYVTSQSSSPVPRDSVSLSQTEL